MHCKSCECFDNDVIDRCKKCHQSLDKNYHRYVIDNSASFCSKECLITYQQGKDQDKTRAKITAQTYELISLKKDYEKIIERIRQSADEGCSYIEILIYHTETLRKLNDQGFKSKKLYKDSSVYKIWWGNVA